MTDEKRDCTQLGHVWLEATGQPFARHRGRTAGKVEVQCRYCLAITELEGRGAFTRGPNDTGPIDKTIPPQFQQVMDRALADSGPVPKTP